jgi:imidazolonepropionase-like amidohydrolase
MKKAFINAKLIPVEGDILESGTLLIDKGKIVDLGMNLSTDGYEVINCGGKTIIPGLIDAHSHVGVFEEGTSAAHVHDGNERTEATVPYLRTMDSLFPLDMGFDDARQGGVTTMGVTHGSANPIGAQFVVVKSMGTTVSDLVIREPAGVKFAMGENPKRVGQEGKRAPHTRMAVAWVIRKAFYDAIDYRLEWEEFEYNVKKNENEEDEKKKKFVKPPKRDLGMEVLLQILDRKIPVRSHAHRADDIETAIRLSEEFGYKLVIEHATESYKIKEMIVEKQIPVVIGPIFGRGSRVKNELRDQQMSTPGVMVKAGAFVCLTTDAPVIPIDSLRDSLIQCIREGLPADKALEIVTINPAKLLEVDHMVGSLKAGKDADFLIFGGDPLDSRNAVLETYINGERVFKR